MRTVSLSDPEKRTITLETRTDNWNVNFIRHKTREAYRIDDKYMVTVAAIRKAGSMSNSAILMFQLLPTSTTRLIQRSR